MERSKGITQAEKVLLRFNKIPRLGIQVSLRKPTRHASSSPDTRLRITEKQQVSDILRQEVYRLIRSPR